MNETAIEILKALGYPISTIVILFVLAYIGRQFFQKVLDSIVARDLEVIKSQNAEKLEQLRKEHSLVLEDRKAELAQETERLKSLLGEDEYIRQLYVGIINYSTEQAKGLRDSYLLLFEELQSSGDRATTISFKERLDNAINMILQPVRAHSGILDEPTMRRMYSVANYLRNFKSSSDLNAEEHFQNKQDVFWLATDEARKYAKVDQIAYRLGLITQPKEARMVKYVRIKVLEDDIYVIGDYTAPNKGDEISIPYDVWMSDRVQKLVKEKKIKELKLDD